MSQNLSRRIRREVAERPEIALATVSGASFLAGAFLGSRLGRAAVALLVPMGIRHFVETDLAPRAWAYLTTLLDEAATRNGGTQGEGGD
jgi:hypothetical protein